MINLDLQIFCPGYHKPYKISGVYLIMIKNFTPRLYQQTIFATCTEKNTLVVLPTGLGKTNIFLMMAAHRIEKCPDSKILFVGPTRPLIDQYLLVFKRHFEIPEDEMAVITGFIKPEKRKELWDKSRIIFSTPQGLQNDIESGKIDLKNVSLLGVDEAHRAVGNYAYVSIAKIYFETSGHPRIIGLTASPGSDIEKISEVCRNLFIEAIESRTESDSDVRQYVKEVGIEWVEVKLPESLQSIKRALDDCLKTRYEKLSSWKLLGRSKSRYNKKELLLAQARIRNQLMHEKNFALMKIISLLAEVIKAQHASELLETQGITALAKYFEKLKEEDKSGKSKAVRNLFYDKNFRFAAERSNELYGAGVEHPKLEALKNAVINELESNPNLKFIVFNHYRDSALKLVNELEKIEGISARLFVGQMKKGETGLSQKEQKGVLDKFRTGEFNCIVSTSIGEEGLDVPAVDLVIFYEPVPSAIRSIQRRGRTGRMEKGKVIILFTKGTRDESYKWTAHHKEKRMFSNLRSIKLEPIKKQNTLERFF